MPTSLQAVVRLLGEIRFHRGCQWACSTAAAVLADCRLRCAVCVSVPWRCPVPGCVANINRISFARIARVAELLREESADAGGIQPSPKRLNSFVGNLGAGIRSPEELAFVQGFMASPPRDMSDFCPASAEKSKLWTLG